MHLFAFLPKRFKPFEGYKTFAQAGASLAARRKDIITQTFALFRRASHIPNSLNQQIPFPTYPMIPRQLRSK